MAFFRHNVKKNDLEAFLRAGIKEDRSEFDRSFDAGQKPLGFYEQGMLVIALYDTKFEKIIHFYRRVHIVKSQDSKKQPISESCCVQLSPSTLEKKEAPTLSLWYLLGLADFLYSYKMVNILPFTGADCATQASVFLLACCKENLLPILKQLIKKGSIGSLSSDRFFLDEANREFSQQINSFSEQLLKAVGRTQSDESSEWVRTEGRALFGIQIKLIKDWFKEILFQKEGINPEEEKRLERLVYFLMLDWEEQYQKIETDWLERKISPQGKMKFKKESAQAEAACAADSEEFSERSVYLSWPADLKLTTIGILEEALAYFSERKSSKAAGAAGDLGRERERNRERELLKPWGVAAQRAHLDLLEKIANYVLAKNQDTQQEQDTIAVRFSDKFVLNPFIAYLLKESSFERGFSRPAQSFSKQELIDKIIKPGSGIYQQLEAIWQLYQSILLTPGVVDLLTNLSKPSEDVSSIEAFTKAFEALFKGKASSDVLYQGTNPYQQTLFEKLGFHFRTLTDEQRKLSAPQSQETEDSSSNARLLGAPPLRVVVLHHFGGTAGSASEVFSATPASPKITPRTRSKSFSGPFS
jgi:hypothetical protein